MDAQAKLDRAYAILKFAFVFVPLAAGADKFTNLLAHWDRYIAPSIAGLLPVSAAAFMMVVGVIEIAAGILVLRWTRLGAIVVAAWLAVVALQLVIAGFLDVAVRDLVMAVAAYILADLADGRTTS